MRPKKCVIFLLCSSTGEVSRRLELNPVLFTPLCQSLALAASREAASRSVRMESCLLRTPCTSFPSVTPEEEARADSPRPLFGSFRLLQQRLSVRHTRKSSVRP